MDKPVDNTNLNVILTGAHSPPGSCRRLRTGIDPHAQSPAARWGGGGVSGDKNVKDLESSWWSLEFLTFYVI